MNRLAESNMHRIVIDIDNMYMQNARFDMNNIITNLLIDALVSNSLSAERMILEHTCLIACLHANVGSEVGKKLILNTNHFVWLHTLTILFHRCSFSSKNY